MKSTIIAEGTSELDMRDFKRNFYPFFISTINFEPKIKFYLAYPEFSEQPCCFSGKVKYFFL